MIVVDASAVVEFLVGGRVGEWVRDEVGAHDERPQAPALVDYEVLSALRRRRRAGVLSAERGAAALRDLGDMGIARYDARPFLARIWALRDTLTAYDAAYVALAEALECPLLTVDRRLARSQGHGATVLVPPDAG